jgi:hypothetical protein
VHQQQPLIFLPLLVILYHILCFHITASLVLCHSYPNLFIYIKLQNILVVCQDLLFFLYSLMANNVAETCSSWYYLQCILCWQAVCRFFLFDIQMSLCLMLPSICVSWSTVCYVLFFCVFWFCKYGTVIYDETSCRWLRLGIKGRWKEQVDRALDFVVAQGRMRYVRPLYRWAVYSRSC